MIWGCITAKGPGFTYKLIGSVNQTLYLEVLQDNLISSMTYYFKDLKELVFMQDNASCHKTLLIMAFLDKQPFETLYQPAQSPDLNPIENIWSILKKKLFQDYNSPAGGQIEHWNRIKDTWNNLDPEICQKALLSMPKRLKQYIKRKGGWTDY